jgi:hypothetical protein
VGKTPQASSNASRERARSFAGNVATGDAALAFRFVCREDDPSRAFMAAALVQSIGRGAATGRAEGDLLAVHPVARQVMEEIGVSLAGLNAEIDPAREGGEMIVLIRNRGVPAPRQAATWSFDDPTAGADEGTSLANFRRVRDEIKRRVDLLLLVRLRQPSTNNPRHQPREGNA